MLGVPSGLPLDRSSAFGEDGEPVHDRGVLAGEPGLYIVGLGRDAEHIAARSATESATKG